MDNEQRDQDIWHKLLHCDRKKLLLTAASCILLLVLGVFAVMSGDSFDMDTIPDAVETTSATAVKAETMTAAVTIVSASNAVTVTMASTVQSTTTGTSARMTQTATQLADITATKAMATPKPTTKPAATPTVTPCEVIKGNYVLVVYKGSQTVVVYEADRNDNYDPYVAYRKMICSTGATSDLTPNGTFKIYAKYIYRALIDAYGQYCTRFNGGILFHSVPIATSARTIEQGRSMIDMNEYNKLGSPASHGCVRMLVCDAKWIYDHCKMNTKVIVTDETSPVGTAGKPALKRYSPYTDALGTYGWDPTDPHPDNPYNNPDIVLVQSVSLNTKEAAVEIGKTMKLKAKVQPENAYESSVTWSSSDVTVATVNSKGKVQALKEGQVVITATTKDGSKTASCIITVQKEIPTTTTTTVRAKPASTPKFTAATKAQTELSDATTIATKAAGALSDTGVTTTMTINTTTATTITTTTTTTATTALVEENDDNP